MAWLPAIVAAAAASHDENRDHMNTDSRMVGLVFATLLLLGGVAVLLFSSMGFQPLVIEINPQMIILFTIAWVGIGVVVVKFVMLRQQRQQHLRHYQQYQYQPYE